ncbi:albusnodin family lasso peptide [Streptomyces sp. NPDC001691]
MDGQNAHLTTTVSSLPEEELVEIGGLVALTQGQGGGQSEDKRRAYNCA